MKTTADHAKDVATTALDKVSLVDSRVSRLEADLKQCKAEQHQLHEQTLRLESYSRRDNLKFESVPESKDEICLDIVRDIISKMDIDPSIIPIIRAHRLGPFRKQQRKPRPIIFRLSNSADRATIWEKRRELKGSGVWLSEDYPA